MTALQQGEGGQEHSRPSRALKFNFEGVSTSGQSRKGKIHAGTEAEAREQIERMGITPTKVTRNQDIELFSNRAPGLKDRALFTQQFAQLLGGGIPQGEALAVAARSTTNLVLRDDAEAIRREVKEGVDIGEAFARPKYARSFDQVFIAFVRLGTESGNLSRPLKELGEMYKWQLRIMGMVKKGLTLPAIISLACIVVTYYIMARVVPTFMGILSELNAELPPLTQMVKTVSEVAKNPYVTGSVIAAVVGAYFLLKRYRATPEGRLATDRLILRTPVLGPLMRTFILARLSRSMSVMLRNGIPIDQTLLIGASVSANAVYAGHVLAMRKEVLEGNPMFPVLLSAERDFPEQFALQFRSAEEKQNLRESLNYLGELYNDEVTSAVEGLTAAIEPLLMIYLGVVVGVIVVSVFLPMTTMMNALSK